MAKYRPDPKILNLGDAFYDAVEPARFPKAIPRFLNTRAAETVGLDAAPEQWAAHFCRFEPLPDNLQRPLALRYHGHQFRVYNPEIGDGRGFLFAQLRDERDRLLDLGTKGSGQTPYSRTADGRLTLKGGVREVLATEMLEALGVNTSRTFALFETGEETDPRRRAFADALFGADPAQSRPHPDRHVSTARLLWRDREISIGSSAIASNISTTSRRAGTECRTRCVCSTWFRMRPPASRRATWRRASSTGCSTATISTSPAKASITGRGGSRRNGIRTSLPPTSTITVSIRSAGSPRRSIGTSRSSPDAWR